MSKQNGTEKPLQGKTYTLYRDTAGSEEYYRKIRELTDLFLRKCTDEKRLLTQIQKASRSGSLPGIFSGRHMDRPLISFIKKTLRNELSPHTEQVKYHLKKLPLSKRTDSTLTTKEGQYHLYMLEIELVNRIYKNAFIRSDHKFALLPHCLRDFRPGCRAASGDIDEVCEGCTDECFINLGSHLLKQYNINPYISVIIEQEKLFKRLKKAHPSIGALGIACIPELVRGMRLCIRLGIPPVGIPLDANRCSRWMKQCQESSFNLEELEALVK